MSAPARDALLAAGRPREFRSGEVVFHQGDPGDSLYLMRSGRAYVRTVNQDGDEVTLGLLVAPDEFGEVGLIRADHHHTATVVAIGSLRVLTVPAARFHTLRIQYPELTDWLLSALVQRLERTSLLLSDALFLDADTRVARRLLDVSRLFAEEPTVRLPITQADVAAMAGVTRPTANRTLRRLEERGILHLGRGHIEINCLDSLERSAR